MERISASERTREELRGLIDGRLSTAGSRSDLVRLAVRLVEEALDAEATEAVGREGYERAAGGAAGRRRPARLAETGGNMTATFRAVFGACKPVIGMVHLGALPGTPLHDAERGLEGLIEHAARDLEALQTAGFDAVMFGNENDRPYEFDVDTASTATMAYVIGRLRECIGVPFGVDVLWDPMSTLALAAATGAAGPSVAPQRFGGVRLLPRPAQPGGPGAIRGFLLNPRRGAGLRGITGEAADMSDLEAAARHAGARQHRVKHATVADVLRVADGCIVGSSLKVDGDTWKPVDPERAADFMARVRAAR